MIDAFVIDELKSYEDKSLRDYQQENKQKVYDVWSGCQSVMLQMPTGTGKTRLFVSLIKDIFHYSRNHKVALKVLILVHRTELIDQIDEELGFRYGLAHGIIQSGDKERKKYPIQLASVQTLSRRLDNWSDKAFDFIIVDEAHHITADSYQKIIKVFPHAKLLGVTATPVRLNGEGFTNTFEELIVSPSVKWFIEKGYLSNYNYYSVSRSSYIQKQIDCIKKFSQGDYAESELERVCDNDRIRAQVVKTYLEYAKGRKGIVYTINKLHNKNLCEEFNKNGIKAVAIDSDTPRELREEYIKQFKQGDFQIICNVNLFTEGFDCPDIEFIQLARPTKSLALYLQQVGRGLRVADEKENTLFLDNVGLYNRFGFPSSKRMWKHHFEGKFINNSETEEEEEEKGVLTVEDVKRPRHQNLEEGNEKVYLIQTTEEKNYLEERKEQLCKWLDDYHKKSCEAYDRAFEDVYINGLGLTGKYMDYLSELGKEYGSVIVPLCYCYHITLREMTDDIKNYIENEEFFFYEYDDDRNVIKREYRKCNSVNELLQVLDHQMIVQRRYTNLSKDMKQLFNQYKELGFTEPELMDIVPELSQKGQVSFNPNYYTGEEAVKYIRIALNAYIDFPSVLRGKNILHTLMKAFMETLDTKKDKLL